MDKLMYLEFIFVDDDEFYRFLHSKYYNTTIDSIESVWTQHKNIILSLLLNN